MKSTDKYWINMIIGLIGAYFFFKSVFYKMYKKHTRRIVNSQKEKLCIFSFFDTKGFIIMAFMITAGISLKRADIIPSLYLGTFYITLGISLFSAAISFASAGIKYENTKIKYFN